MSGVVILKHGLEAGVTDAMIEEIDAMYVEGGGSTNIRETQFSARNAWAAIRGYVCGDDVNKGLEMTKPPAPKAPKAEEAEAAAE